VIQASSCKRLAIGPTFDLAHPITVATSVTTIVHSAEASAHRKELRQRAAHEHVEAGCDVPTRHPVAPPQLIENQLVDVTTGHGDPSLNL